MANSVAPDRRRDAGRHRRADRARRERWPPATPEAGAAITLLVAGACYCRRRLVAATMRRDLLGPARGSRAAAAAQDARPNSRLVAGGLAPGCGTSAGARPGGRARRDRRQPGYLRDLVPDVDLALPQLLLPDASASTAETHYGYLVAAGGRRLLLRGADHPDSDPAADQDSLIALMLAGSAVVIGGPRRDLQPGRLPIHGLLPWPGRAGRRHLRDHDPAAAGAATTTAAGCSRSTTCCSTSPFAVGAADRRRRSCRRTASPTRWIAVVAVGYAARGRWLLAAAPSARGRGPGRPVAGSRWHAQPLRRRPAQQLLNRPLPAPAGRAPSAAPAGTVDARPTSGPGGMPSMAMISLPSRSGRMLVQLLLRGQHRRSAPRGCRRRAASRCALALFLVVQSALVSACSRVSSGPASVTYLRTAESVHSPSP